MLNRQIMAKIQNPKHNNHDEYRLVKLDVELLFHYFILLVKIPWCKRQTKQLMIFIVMKKMITTL